MHESEQENTMQLQQIIQNYDIVRSLPPTVNQNHEIPVEMLDSRKIIKTESFYYPEEDLEDVNEESEDLLETTVEHLSKEIPIHVIHPSENTSDTQSTVNETIPCNNEIREDCLKFAKSLYTH